ncbi:MAG: hypothetical protein ACJ76H_03730 [Bacteriovoracaceae bacterium]
MDWLLKKRTLSTLAMLFFVMTGTYNAIVINSESHLNGADIRFVKRLDELNGIVEPGRLVATGIQWQKLAPVQTVTTNALHVPVVQEVKTIASSSGGGNEVAPQGTPAAAVTEELNLNLVEVINPKKYQNGLSNDQFAGSLTTANGTIDSLTVSLPQSEGLTVSFSEMNGNVFEYDIDGEVYSGMLYQVDQNAYMVTLTNGPLEGTRLRFVGEPSQEQVAATEQMNTGNTGNDEFGNPGDQPEAQTVQAEEAKPEVQAAAEPAPEQMVNMEQPPQAEQAAADPDAQFQQQAHMDINQESNG